MNLMGSSTLGMKRNFRLYLAKGYSIIGFEKEDDVAIINYLILSLYSHNKYLQLNTNFGIGNTDRNI